MNDYFKSLETLIVEYMSDYVAGVEKFYGRNGSVAIDARERAAFVVCVQTDRIATEELS